LNFFAIIHRFFSSTTPLPSTQTSINSGDLPIVIKWNSNEIPISITQNEFKTVTDLKRKIQEITHVNVKRQKLLGLKYQGKPYTNINDDNVEISDLSLKANQKIMMMGTAEENIEPEPNKDDIEVLDDFEITSEELQVHEKEENIKKLQNRVTTRK